MSLSQVYPEHFIYKAHIFIYGALILHGKLPIASPIYFIYYMGELLWALEHLLNVPLYPYFAA